ncbi:MAG: hypothetical protein KC591_10535 [Gemmatimonadetes bacterium]|nr:hypothetical protein [Gemmatimonadota bacterium]
MIDYMDPARARVRRTGYQILVAWILWGVPTQSRSEERDDRRKPAAGLVMGEPQKVGILFERPISRWTAWQLQLGTNLDDYSLGARWLVGAPNAPYVFVAVGANSRGGLSSLPRPWSEFGVGMSAGNETVRFFGDVGILPGTGLGASVGVLASVERPADSSRADDRRVWRRDRPADAELNQRDASVANDRDYRSGVSSGFPYAFAFSYEQRVAEAVSVSLHAGSLIVAGSVGMRAIVGAQDGTGLYAFGGGGWGYVLAIESPGVSTLFAFEGLGARYCPGTIGPFAEVGLAQVARWDELGTPVLPVAAVGLLFQAN